MEDKDFLGYFSKLGDKNLETVKESSSNIVSILLATD